MLANAHWRSRFRRLPSAGQGFWPGNAWLRRSGWWRTIRTGHRTEGHEPRTWPSIWLLGRNHRCCNRLPNLGPPCSVMRDVAAAGARGAPQPSERAVCAPALPTGRAIRTAGTRASACGMGRVARGSPRRCLFSRPGAPGILPEIGKAWLAWTSPFGRQCVSARPLSRCYATRLKSGHQRARFLPSALAGVTRQDTEKVNPVAGSLGQPEWKSR